MALSALGRKHLLEFGKQKEIALRLGLSEAFVSNVVNGLVTPRTAKGRRTVRRVQVAVSRALNMSVAEAFGESPSPSFAESAA